jgi:thioredoxin 1
MFHLEGGKKQMYDIIQRNQTERGPEPVFLLDFMAEWCGPCKRISPLIENLLQKNYPRRLIIFKIDVDIAGNEDIVSDFSVSSMPTLVWLMDGQIYKRLEGADGPKIETITADARRS